MLSPAGNATLCGQSLTYWQKNAPGVLQNVTAGAIPADLTAEAIVDMARATLAA